MARQFKMVFEGPPYNYKVFFDYSECTDNYFSDIILPAIQTGDFFVLVLTKDCLLRCSNEGDWVRREIEEAIAYKRKIIPITPDKECESFPPSLPDSLRKAFDGLQITTIYTDHMFEACVDFLIKNRFHLTKEKKESKVHIEETSRGLLFTFNNESFNMVFVEGGTFQMGNSNSDALLNEKPVHKVTLDSYYIGETVVTQALWEAVMGGNPSHRKGFNFPVESVSWEDCQKFISDLHRLTGKDFRLPTEAEWEYAARGGKKGVESSGYGLNKYSGARRDYKVSFVQEWVDRGLITSDQAKEHPLKDEFFNGLSDVAWYNGNSVDKIQNVKVKFSNELGLYDMSGNVWEWCGDWYDYYSSNAQVNPTGPISGKYRVLRGGSVHETGRECRVSYRGIELPDFIGCYHGFRLALSH